MFTCTLLLLILPFTAGILFSILRDIKEETVSRVATGVGLVNVASVIWMIASYFYKGLSFYSYTGPTLYSSQEYHFPLNIYVDSLSLLWLFMTVFLSGLVIRFSHIYLHKEIGYQRFFACLMFLVFGLVLLGVAGGLDLFIAGWEFVGLSSFLLIGFYHERNVPVRNSMRVYSIYRLCDTGLLLSAWLSHALLHESQGFQVLHSPEMQQQLHTVNQVSLTGMSALILFAAAGKSAQFPFSFWLSRAMEGPTPSSAIFYGALSVHAGVFLLFRTFPIWHTATFGPYLVGGLGLLTVFVASSIARTQSNIKGQIAYSSAAHVGMIFFELALGFKTVAMLHIFANASLRCYQLLVSPSSVVYLLRLQGSQQVQSTKRTQLFTKLLSKRLVTTFYVFAMNDGFLEQSLKSLLWKPLGSIGKEIQKKTRFFYWGFLPLAIIVAYMVQADFWVHSRSLAVFISVFLGGALTLSALSERRSAIRAWHTIMISNVLVAFAVWILEKHIETDLLIFFSGISIAWPMGLQALLSLKGTQTKLSLETYHGLVLKQPGIAFVLFIAVLMMTGFPISPTFIGQDLLLHHTVEDFVWLAIILGLIFAFNGLALMRIYVKTCLGSRES